MVEPLAADDALESTMLPGAFHKEPGYVEDASDCDDTDGATHPGAAEACDGADGDCDGAIDGPLADAWCSDPLRLAPLHADTTTCEAATSSP